RDRGVARLCVEDGRLRIEARARPVDAAARIADVDRSEILAAARRQKRGRDERGLFPAVRGQIIARLLTQLRREVDHVVAAHVSARERRWLGDERLRRRSLFTGNISLRYRPLFDPPDRLTGDAVEHVEPSLFARLREQLAGAAIDVD